ncbi:DUF2147 domain-containing protein [Glacieibacterium megasporae]|uniref:DUF2147 domain-containing protein n=1 Tax=Glacieibacterium megasporae TaxID=2835787 RepID=UPI001C1E8325|nr:DUF2147 domain-containing protein [Polymorphobacter megasporae]UAJ09510.1 DUF2147 domain-containing protein [Polymorphobacter megasporae]
MHRLPLVVLAALASVAAVTPLHAAGITGTWHNPAGSVEVAMAPCGPRLCGTVVRANDKARDDAARGGTDQLVGTQLFRGLAADGPDHWTGEVFVPDIGQTVAGTLAQVGPNALEVSGCVIPGLVCQTQTWTRVAARR